MGHIKDRDEQWAWNKLDQIIQRSREDRDALPGEVVELCKKAARKLKMRRKPKPDVRDDS